MTKCKTCGAVVQNGKFCQACGVRLIVSNKIVKKSKRTSPANVTIVPDLAKGKPKEEVKPEVILGSETYLLAIDPETSRLIADMRQNLMETQMNVKEQIKNLDKIQKHMGVKLVSHKNPIAVTK